MIGAFRAIGAIGGIGAIGRVAKCRDVSMFDNGRTGRVAKCRDARLVRPSPLRVTAKYVSL